jgi:hypothetical protein
MKRSKSNSAADHVRADAGETGVTVAEGCRKIGIGEATS